jgi:flagellar biosynthetic protein FlhB
VAEDRDEERNEPATPKRREEARQRGHVARSHDLSSAGVLLAAVAALWFFGRSLAGNLAGSAAQVLEGLAGVDGDREGLMLRFGSVLTGAFLGALPVLATLVIASLAVNLAQVGFLWAPGALLPKPERLDPAAGLARIFSLKGLARLVAGLLKVGLVGAVVGWTLWSERTRLHSLGDFAFEGVVGTATGLMFTLSFRAALALLLLAVLDYGYQRWQYERDLRMSRQEVREELKRLEGDPRMKERRRGVQRQLALQRMMQSVPQATVVITNPTHVAVAVKYRQNEMEAPLVVAKGAELLAQRIRETALEHDVPVVERRELARTLYASVEVGQQIPPELYQAVAEILAFVFRLKGGVAAA